MVHEPVNGLEKLALMRSKFCGVEFPTKSRVFVDEPRLSQNVRSRVFQLHTQRQADMKKSISHKPRVGSSPLSRLVLDSLNRRHHNHHTNFQNKQLQPTIITIRQPENRMINKAGCL